MPPADCASVCRRISRSSTWREPGPRSMRSPVLTTWAVPAAQCSCASTTPTVRSNWVRSSYAPCTSANAMTRSTFDHRSAWASARGIDGSDTRIRHSTRATALSVRRDVSIIDHPKELLRATPHRPNLAARQAHLHHALLAPYAVPRRQVRSRRDRNVVTALELPFGEHAESRCELRLRDFAQARHGIGGQPLHAHRAPQLAAV